QPPHHLAVLAVLRAPRAIREGRRASASFSLGFVQSRGREQWRCGYLARNLSCQTRRFRMYLQQHAALRSCSGDEVRARAGSPRICGRTHVVAPLVRSGFMAAYLNAEQIITQPGKCDESRNKEGPIASNT